MQINNQTKSVNPVQKPTLLLKRFKKLKDNPFAVFDKLTNVVYHMGSIEDAETMTVLLNQLHQQVTNQQNKTQEVYDESSQVS